LQIKYLLNVLDIMDGILGVIVIIICGVLIIVGLILSLLNLPGVWLIFLSYLIVSLVYNFEIISVGVLLLVLLIVVLSTFIDNVLLILSTKYIGGGKWGVWGAIVGAFAALFMGNLVLSAVAPLVGATLFELAFEKRPFKLAVKAGFGTLVGMIISIFMKFIINVGLIILWIFLIIGR